MAASRDYSITDVWITKADFDVGTEIDKLRVAGVGAIATFSGVVRDNAEDQRLTAMTLEHFPGMTEREIQIIIDQARGRWPLKAIRVIHRVGRLLPQENIVFVGTASAHRQAAFDGAAFIMDYLKTRAPFWKKEETSAGANWVEAREIDDIALQKWMETGQA
jgi:molybdopterin synthase catalytic subunit